MAKKTDRIVYWDPYKTGDKLGQPYQYGITYQEWLKKNDAEKPKEWKKPQS